MPVFLADTTVLSNFAQTQRPDLLRRAFPGLMIPREVREELAKGERLGLVPICDWSWLKAVELTAAEQARAADLESRVQAGEAVCLAIVEHRGGLLLTDDRAARRLALSLGLEISGTIGVLLKLLQREILTLDQGDRLLNEMMAGGYWSPVRSLREI